MKTTVNEYQFRDAFMRVRPDNFTYDGLTALYDYLTSYEEDCDTELELDIIAFCCDFTEDSISNILDNYGLDNLEDLQDRTTVIYVDDLKDWRNYDKDTDGDKLIIIQNF